MKTNEIYTDVSTNMKLKNTKFLKHKSRGGILTVEKNIYNAILFIQKIKQYLKDSYGYFLGGPVVKSPPANAGDMCSIPDPGRPHIP